LVVLLWAPLAAAQTSKGAITGNATDPDGAVVPGAAVTVTNTGTNASRQATTDADGNFRVEVLDPGTYRVTFSLKGFKTTAVDNVLVRAAQITSVDVKLEAGQLEETIEVIETTGADLQKESGERASTINAREVVELPISSLNVIQLTLTLPGVVAPSGREDFTNGIGITVNGNRPRGNNFLLDGQDNNDLAISGQSYFPTNREAIQEVTLLGGDNSAEYGRAGAAVVNVVTQGGTNEYHGAASWLYQSQLFNAVSPDERRNGLTEPDVFTENIAAFKLGGPIFKNKLLGFGSAQWDRFRSTDNSAGSVRVPTEAGLATLRSVFPAGSNRNVDLFLNAIGPLRGRTNLSLIPLGRAANGQNRPNVEFGLTSREGISTIADDTQFVTRVDWLPNANNTATFRYLFDDSFFFPALVGLPGEDIFVPARNHNMAINYNRTFSDRMINEFRFSYGRQRVPFDVIDKSILTRPFISIGTLIGLGVDATFPQDRLANNWQWQDTLRLIKADHTISVGVDFNRQLPRITNLLNDRGSVNFANGGGYVAFGNFVDNFSGPRATITRDFGERIVYPNTFFQNYFVSNSWKARPNLTLVLGLRYENYGTPENILKFPAHTGNPFQDFLQPIKQEPDNNNFAPRFSFAYTPRFWRKVFGEDRTVLRGGWGIGYEAFFYNILINTGSGNPNIISFNQQAGTGRGFFDPIGILQSTPTPSQPTPSGAIITVDQFLKNPQIHNWNFGVQRELPWNVLFDLAYVGTRGIRLFVNDEKNPGVDGVRINPIHSNIILRSNSGDSNYHSMQLKVERRFSASAAGNLFLRGSYTWSRYIDNGSEVFVTTGDSSFPQNTFNRDLDRGLTAFHRKQRFVLTYVWEIPGPPRSDKRGLNALGYVLRDWQLSGITTFQSGAPFTVVNGTIDSNGDARPFNDRVSLGNPNAPRTSFAVSGLVAGGEANLFYDGPAFVTRNELVPVSPSSVRWLVIGQGLGNVGRNTELGRPFNQTDFTIGRSFRIPRLEGHSLEFRWEAFNLFNHPNSSIGLLSFNPLDGPEQFLNFDLTKTGFRSSRFYLRYSF
jgi:outer membrane receptor protein involved in Fe transport